MNILAAADAPALQTSTLQTTTRRTHDRKAGDAAAPAHGQPCRTDAGPNPPATTRTAELAPSALADAILLFASLQPLIEGRGSLVVHLTGTDPSTPDATVAAALAAAASRHRWCRTLRLALCGQTGERQAAGLLARHRAGEPLPLDGAHPIALVHPGEDLPRPGELASLYEALRTRFALVLVETGCVADVPDTAILSQAADLTLLVVQAGRSRLADIARARALLEQGGGTRIALVLTHRRRLVPGILDRILDRILPP